MFDTHPRSLDEGLKYVSEILPSIVASIPGAAAGRMRPETDLAIAVRNAWLVVEAVPEQLNVKREVFAQLDSMAPKDAILASNSSSYPSSQLIDKVARPERVLNMHYYMPPELCIVELMSCGKTDPAIIDFLMERLPLYGLMPFRVQRESPGFIFNRIWAAIKRESLSVVEEGVAKLEDVDRIWSLFTASQPAPFRLMDRVGLDVVLAIEERYAAIREGVPEGPRRLLQRYVDDGRLGVSRPRFLRRLLQVSYARCPDVFSRQSPRRWPTGEELRNRGEKPMLMRVGTFSACPSGQFGWGSMSSIM